MCDETGYHCGDTSFEFLLSLHHGSYDMSRLHLLVVI